MTADLSPAVVADVTVTAERLVAGGDALAHLPDGRVAFVDGALPGERVVMRPLAAPTGRRRCTGGCRPSSSRRRPADAAVSATPSTPTAAAAAVGSTPSPTSNGAPRSTSSPTPSATSPS